MIPLHRLSLLALLSVWCLFCATPAAPPVLDVSAGWLGVAVQPEPAQPRPADAAEPPKPATPAPEPPKITGQDVVQEHTLVRLTVTGIPVGYAILWDIHPFGIADKTTNVKLRSVVEFVAPPGVYQVQVRGVKDEDVVEAFKTVTIQGRTPAPVPPGPGPTPPGPTPQPPAPTPPAPPAPIAGDGNRVLIVYETGQLHTPTQAAIFTSGVLRDYLDAKCAKDQHNPTGAYRIWDKDVDLNHPSVSLSWKAAMARPRTGVPWIVVSNGKTGYEGALPANVNDTIALLKKYFGD